MNPTIRFIIGFALLALLASGCSAPATPPPPTETPVPTATIPPTSTPIPTDTPTPTATPVPFGLAVSVLDEQGAPIAGALLALSVDGAAVDETQTDATGAATWSDLPGEAVSLDVTAQGYQPAQLAQTIARGENQVSVTLARDAFAPLPSEVCAAGETLFYIEDFQDQSAQGWPEIEFGAMGWTIEDDPQNPGNLVVAARQGTPWVFYDRDNVSLGNVVWRLRYQYSGKAISHLNFRFIETGELNARYMFVGGMYSHLQRIENELTVGLADFPVVKADTWHLLEMAYYDGVMSIYLDGKKLIEYTDPQPWEGGSINLEPYPQDEAAAMYYDDLVLCNLSAPFAPLPTPDAGN